MLSWIKVRWLYWPSQNIPLLWHKKMLKYALVHCTATVWHNIQWAFGWVWADNIVLLFLHISPPSFIDKDTFPSFWYKLIFVSFFHFVHHLTIYVYCGEGFSWLLIFAQICKLPEGCSWSGQLLLLLLWRGFSSTGKEFLLSTSVVFSVSNAAISFYILIIYPIVDLAKPNVFVNLLKGLIFQPNDLDLILIVNSNRFQMQN